MALIGIEADNSLTINKNRSSGGEGASRTVGFFEQHHEVTVIAQPQIRHTDKKTARVIMVRPYTLLGKQRFP